MTNVVFAVPFALPNTLRFVEAATSLPDTRLGIVSQSPAQSIPPELQSKLQGFQQVKDAMDPDHLAQGVAALGASWGGKVDTLIGVLEQLQVPLAQAREKLGIPGMSSEAANNFRDKARMKEILRDNDLPCARHCLANTSQEAIAFSKDCGFPLVVKPPAGAGAKQTFRVESAEELTQSLRMMPPSPRQPVLLEEFITGREFSLDTVSIKGKHVFHSISHYYPTPLEVMENPWIQWCVLLPKDIEVPEYDAILSAGPRALDALGMDTGITHMEWFQREDGTIALSEVGARPPGAQIMSLLSYAHDMDFYKAWPRMMAFEEFTPPKRQYATGAAFIRGQGRGRVTEIKGLQQVRSELGDLVVEASLPRRGHTPSGSYEGEGFVILRHPETKVVEDGLKRLVSLLHVELS